jgi:hypothetical protein
VTGNYIDYIGATRDAENSYAMIYLPENKSLKIDLSKISGSTKNAWWYDPRTGKAIASKSIKGNGTKTFTPPKEGKDWVLVIDDASKGFKEPGGE